MIAYQITSPNNSGLPLRLCFSVWAKSQPKDYLSAYPVAAQHIQQERGDKDIFLMALVDDVWPAIFLGRTQSEQKQLSNLYVSSLPTMGFHEVVLASNLVEKNVLEECLSFGTKITTSEFKKLLPETKKKRMGSLGLEETIEFLWQLCLLKHAIDAFQINGLLAGIRSEFFYLSARKVLPAHDTYFVNTTNPISEKV